jgi:hypothetical protein
VQEAEFSGSDGSWRSANDERHGIAVQLKIGSSDAGGQRLFKTPQYRPDTRCELASPERFSDVVVSAKIQAAYPVFFTGPSSQKDDRNAGKIAVLADLTAYFKAAVTGNHNVEHKENRRMLARQRQHFVSRNTDAHVEPGQLQVVAYQIADVRVIFENKNVLLQWDRLFA